jgi:fibronectin-binding autotransporter adhesin
MYASWFGMIGPIGLTGVLLLGGCNSTTDNGSGSGTSNASATGVWSGSDSVSGLGVTALINAAGQATFIRSDGIQFTGTVQVSGSTLAVTVDGYTDFASTFSDGSTYGIGTLDGTVTTGSSMSATLAFTTNGGTAISGTWSLSYGALSTDASSTSTISSNYTDTSNNVVLAINANGVMNGQNAANGCVLNGSVTTNDGTTNVYEVAYSYGNCTGNYAVLNGVQFTGLATLTTGSAAGQLVMAVTGASSTTEYGIVSTLTGG